jgi:hypothetical protein
MITQRVQVTGLGVGCDLRRQVFALTKQGALEGKEYETGAVFSAICELSFKAIVYLNLF